ncbi:MAG TPA: hypothetical protein VKG25_27935, partial [Bryobacteraceae bacterium]|nr:hypothetical protein [Bryobacteraceae bacterium]
MSYSRCFWFFALAAAAALFLCSCNRPSTVQARAGEAPTVRVVSAIAKDVPLDLSSIGNVEAIASVDVKS